MKRLLFGVLLMISCAKPDKDFDDYPPQKVLEVTPSATTAVANGLDVIKIAVAIDKRTDPSNREIVMNTTLGTFLESQGKEVKVVADANGEANATLVAPLTAGTAYLTVKSGTFSQSQSIQFQPADLAQVLKVVPSATTAVANGFDEIKIAVAIDKRTDPSNREIVMNTTLGTFLESQGKEVKVVADANGEANATLVAPLTAGTAYLTVKSGAFSQSQSIQFQPADPSKIITIAGPASKEANGLDTAQFTVSVPPALYQQTINVSVTKGTLVNSNAATLAAKPGTDGKLLLTLRSPTTPGIGYLNITAGDFEIVQAISFTPADPTKILKLQAPASAEADGASIVEIIMQVPANTDISQSDITLSASAGEFVPSGGTTINNVKPDINGRAIVQLRAPSDVSTAFITADVASVRQTVAINFTRAYPDRIIVDPGTYTLKAGSGESVTVEAKLLRSVGITSRDVEVEFRALDSTGTKTLNQGQFRLITRSNPNGSATAQYTIGDSPYRGKAIIRASVNTPKGVVQGQESILIINP